MSSKKPTEEKIKHIGTLESDEEFASEPKRVENPPPKQLKRKKDYIIQEEQKFLHFIQSKQYSNKGTPQQNSEIRRQLEETIDRQLSHIRDNSEVLKL